MDSKAAAKGQLQIIVKENTKEEAGRQKEVEGEGAQDVCDKADTDAKRNARPRLH